MITQPQTPGGVFRHADLSDLPTSGGDPHLEYLRLAGRAGGQDAFGGTGAGEELTLRGSSNANLGLIRARSPIDFDDVTAANALSPYSVRDASSATISAGFIGGTFADFRNHTFQNALFIYETLRGSPTLISAVAPAFAAFTLFNALPTLRGGTNVTHTPLQALILNAGPAIEAGAAGVQTSPAATGVNFAPQLRPLAAGRTIAVTNITGLTCGPVWNTVLGSIAAFGTIRAAWARNPTVALFGSSAGLETLTAYHAFDVDALPFGGNVSKSALRSGITAATNARFLRNNGGAASEFGGGAIDNPGQISFNADITGISFGASTDLSMGWAGGPNRLYMQFAAPFDQLHIGNPSADRFIFEGDAGNTVTEFNFNVARFSMGAQSGAVGNQVGNFVAGTRSTGVAGGWSDFLLTQGANLTVDHAMSQVFGWTVNAPSMTLGGGGSVTDAGALLVGGNVNQGTNRYGVLILSNPTNGYALRCLNGDARFDGRVDINNGVALGGGAAATLGTIGGSGPTGAAQSQWVEIDINGTPHWIPAWV